MGALGTSVLAVVMDIVLVLMVSVGAVDSGLEIEVDLILEIGVEAKVEVDLRLDGEVGVRLDVYV